MRVPSIAVFVGLVLAVGLTVAGETDFHNCGICKPMMADSSLMQNMNWEAKTIATGMLSITTVKAGHEEAYQKVNSQMMDNIKKLESGAEMDLCPFCQGMNKLAQAGAQIENIDGAGAHVTAVTSQDPAVIEKIHNYAKWVQEENAKMKHEHGG